MVDRAAEDDALNHAQARRAVSRPAGSTSVKLLELLGQRAHDPLRAILASMSEGVYSTDLDGRIVWMNRAAEEIAGRRAVDVAGRNYVDALGLVDEDDVPLSQVERPLECCIAAKQPVYLSPAYLTRPDGRRVPIALSTSPILDPMGGPALCVAVFRDLSRDRELEEMKVNLVSLVSHELRTPLGHIRGFASTLLQRDVQWDRETRQEFLRDIEREVERLDKLITDLLDMSRMQAGLPDSLERRPVAIPALVAAALERVGSLVADREVAVDAPENLPEVPVDAGAMSRVLANLIENAAKYSPAGSPIRVSAARAGDEVRIRVEDSGPGIPPADLERVFEKFVRLESPGAVRAPGVGLGLAICRGIVNAHGGVIWAENRDGGGARFVVSLPLSAARAPRRSRP